jgi:hypothetical protein
LKELLAILTVRRLLLELGQVLEPGDVVARIGPLQLWVALPRSDLHGLSPIGVLAEIGGEERLRQCLIGLVGDSGDPTPAPATRLWERKV